MYVYLSVKLFWSTPNYPNVVNLPSSGQIKQNESLTQLSGFTFLFKVHCYLIVYSVPLPEYPKQKVLNYYLLPKAEPEVILTNTQYTHTKASEEIGTGQMAQQVKDTG